MALDESHRGRAARPIATPADEIAFHRPTILVAQRPARARNANPRVAKALNGGSPTAGGRTATASSPAGNCLGGLAEGGGMNETPRDHGPSRRARRGAAWKADNAFHLRLYVRRRNPIRHRAGDGGRWVARGRSNHAADRAAGACLLPFPQGMIASTRGASASTHALGGYGQLAGGPTRSAIRDPMGEGRSVVLDMGTNGVPTARWKEPRVNGHADCGRLDGGCPATASP